MYSLKKERFATQLRDLTWRQMNEAMSRFRIIYKFWVPADLAWGKKGTGSEIPPNAVLCFDIRIVEIC